VQDQWVNYPAGLGAPYCDMYLFIERMGRLEEWQGG